MIIDQLPSITLPVDGTDEIPIERGQYTYKTNVADLLSGASADMTVIAAEYDDSASYAVGDYCTHEGLFYICTTAVTAEAWDATKWDEITVGDELQSKPDATAFKAFTVTLASASWSSNAQTVSNVNFLASGYAYIVSPASASFTNYGTAQIYADDVTTDGSMTFHCVTAPSSNLTVNVIRTVAS